MTTSIPLSRRRGDLLIVAFFLLNLLVITYVVDLEQLVIPDPAHFTYPLWPPRFAVDALQRQLRHPRAGDDRVVSSWYRRAASPTRSTVQKAFRGDREPNRQAFERSGTGYFTRSPEELPSD